jgi:hypothetical protein
VAARRACAGKGKVGRHALPEMQPASRRGVRGRRPACAPREARKGVARARGWRERRSDNSPLAQARGRDRPRFGEETARGEGQSPPRRGRAPTSDERARREPGPHQGRASTFVSRGEHCPRRESGVRYPTAALAAACGAPAVAVGGRRTPGHRRCVDSVRNGAFVATRVACCREKALPARTFVPRSTSNNEGIQAVGEGADVSGSVCCREGSAGERCARFGVELCVFHCDHEVDVAKLALYPVVSIS